MLRPQIEDMLADNESWREPKNEQAREAFIGAMRARHYGYASLESAWFWFLTGWKAVS